METHGMASWMTIFLCKYAVFQFQDHYMESRKGQEQNHSTIHSEVTVAYRFGPGPDWTWASVKVSIIKF